MEQKTNEAVCPICGKEYIKKRPTKYGGMSYFHAGDPSNVFCQQSSQSYKPMQDKINTLQK